MKLKASIGVLVIIVILFSGCYDREGEESDIFTYRMDEQIINPPDSFRILMPLRPNTVLRTFFQDSISSVWKINKQQASNRLVWLKRTISPDSSKSIYINQDTLGLEADIQYQILGSNNNFDEQRTVYVKFVRLSLNYEDFPQKF